jgi:hypothetical protein
MVLLHAITLGLEAYYGQLAFGPITGGSRHLLYAFVDRLGGSYRALCSAAEHYGSPSTKRTYTLKTKASVGFL